MDPSWNEYPAAVDGDPVLIEFDEAASEPQLREELPALARIEIEVIAPDERRLPSPMELRALDHEQAQLEDLLAKHGTGARVIARVTGLGAREMVLAEPEVGRAGFVLRKWQRKIEREMNVRSAEDGWSFFDQYVWPGAAQRDWIQARDAVADALDQGADPSGSARLRLGDGSALEVALDPGAITEVLATLPEEAAWTLEW
ncbi:MAG: DUF695 domain-containing protein [Planctomycetota bacterium]|nr:DUF695 domain-containing protein [Planctomycetota bacterium]